MLLFLFLLLSCLVVGRVPKRMREFSSVAVEAEIQRVSSKLSDALLKSMFVNCFPNTLDTTVRRQGNSSFIITGDIDAMWLRDSTNQLMPYMPYVTDDAPLDELVRGVLREQIKFVLVDPYANAFQMDDSRPSPHRGDHSTKHAHRHRMNRHMLNTFNMHVDGMSENFVFERKFEIDSLCAFLKLGNEYFEASHNLEPFDAHWLEAVTEVLRVFRLRQRAQQRDYTFVRVTGAPRDTLEHGVGTPFRVTGLLSSPFRPSDDATTFQYHIPANAFAVVELGRLAHVLDMLHERKLARRARRLRSSIDKALRKHGIIERGGKRVFAYEVDGFGNALFMDDANVPSLLSLPLLGYVNRTDALYKNTRAAILNASFNPYFFESKHFRGVGSPHTPVGNIWPMSLIVQALTSTSDDEIKSLLHQLTSTGADVMHESFDAHMPSRFTRAWFAWANGMFGSLIVKLVQEKRL